jgi:hypothetical protein
VDGRVDIGGVLTRWQKAGGGKAGGRRQRAEGRRERQKEEGRGQKGKEEGRWERMANGLLQSIDRL